LIQCLPSAIFEGAMDGWNFTHRGSSPKRLAPDDFEYLRKGICQKHRVSDSREDVLLTDPGRNLDEEWTV